MKVVLFCGGLGLRMREASARIPKPMVQLGNRPVLWHVMKYFAHYGHTDFILCLGHQAEVVKQYFLNYDEALSNDFVITQGGQGGHEVELLQTDIRDWRITFVDTGFRAKIGQRLKAVRPHLEGEETFLVNYGDVLTDAPLPAIVENFERSGRIGSVLCVRPNYTFHVVELDGSPFVRGIQNVTTADLWINGGYFVFRQEIFDYIHEGEDLVVEPFKRLSAEEQLVSYRYEGFWAPMDTLKDKNVLEALLESGAAPWRVWEANGSDYPEQADIDRRLAEAERLSE
jgi:glucose-1-phosphate cytidylyltransferase